MRAWPTISARTRSHLSGPTVVLERLLLLNFVLLGVDFACGLVFQKQTGATLIGLFAFHPSTTAAAAAAATAADNTSTECDNAAAVAAAEAAEAAAAEQQALCVSAP